MKDKEKLSIEELTDEEPIKPNIFENIENTVYVSATLLLTSEIFKSIHTILNTRLRFKIICLYSIANLGINYAKYLQNKENEKNIELSPYKNLLHKITKKLKPICFAFNLAALTISGFPILLQSTQEYRVERNNPFDGKTTSLPEMGITNADAVNIIIEGVEDNILLTKEEIAAIKNLKQCFEENPYLDYEQVYKNLSSVNVFYVKSKKKMEEGVAADYDIKNNDIRIYNNYPLNLGLPHEAIHASGNLEHRFLTEGFASILESEYLFDGEIQNGYSIEILLTELVIELTSKDIVLQAFSQKNEDLIVKKLEENHKCLNGKEFLDSLEVYAVCAKELPKGTVTEDEFVYYFTPAAEQLVSYLENQKFDEWTQIYIKNLLYQTIEGEITELPKFNYNKLKDHSYPEIIDLSRNKSDKQEENYSSLKH